MTMRTNMEIFCKSTGKIIGRYKMVCEDIILPIRAHHCGAEAVVPSSTSGKVEIFLPGTGIRVNSGTEPISFVSAPKIYLG